MHNARNSTPYPGTQEPRALTRRRFLRGAGAAGAVAAAFPATVAAQQQPTVLRLQGAWPARNIFHEYALDFCKKINDMSGGRLRAEVLPAGAVVKTAELLDAVHKGIIDGCHAVPSMWHARDSSFHLFGAGPALGMDANGLLAWMRHGGGAQMHAELVHRQLSLNVVSFLCGPMPPQPLGWFKKPVKSSAEFKGLKIRAAGLAAELLREMGAIIETVAEQDIVAALRSGQIHAAQLNNASSDLALGLPEAAKFCMLQSLHQPGDVFEVLLSRAKYEALPADLQAIVRHAAEACSADMSWKALHRYSSDQARLHERHGAIFQKTPVEVLRAQMKAWGVVAARHAKNNPLFDRIWQSQQDWARRTVGWSRETQADPALAYDFWFTAQRSKA